MSVIVLPEVDYEDLALRLRRDGLRMSERLTGPILKAQDKKGMAVIERTILFGSCEPKVSHPAACAFLWETADPSCLELGSVWVHMRYRRKRNAVRVMREAMELECARGKELVMFTPHLSVMHDGMKLGFVPVTAAVKPDVEDWARKRGLWQRRPTSALSLSPPTLVEGERQLLIRS